MRKFKYLGLSDKVFYIVNACILTLFFIMVLYPCVYVVSASLSEGMYVNNGKVVLFPVGFTWENYKLALSMEVIWVGFFNSVWYAILDVVISVTLTMMVAYALSRDNVPGSKAVMFLYLITMFFNGGLIPTYLVIRGLNLINTVWALVLPGAVTAYRMIVARTFIKNSIPHELLEASVMDGCSDIGYFLRIVIPLSKPIIAVNVLNTFVGNWNAYMNPLIYLNDRDKYTLPIYLKDILLSSVVEVSEGVDYLEIAKMNERMAAMKYSVIVITMIPILILYPFIQKYFVKGVMVGSVKG